MYTLTINFRDSKLGYNLSFVNGKAANSARDSIYAAKKDDPMGRLTVTDDFSQEAAFLPVDVLACLTAEVERVNELIIQRSILDVKRNIEQQQRAAGDPEIQMAATKAQLANLNAKIPQGQS